MPSTNLNGRRVAVLAADGFEKLEYTVPVKALQVAGAEIDVISLQKGKIRSVNQHEPAGRIRVDKTLDQANASDYDALFIPGGYINPDLLRQSAAARAFVEEFDAAQKPIATLCHGPWVLASAGLIEGRVLTSWPGVRDDLVNAGATWVDEPVVRDRNLITSRGPQDLPAFAPAIVQHFSQNRFSTTEVRREVSSPQRSEPPNLSLSTTKWLPRASVILGLAAIGGVLLFQTRSRGLTKLLGGSALLKSVAKSGVVKNFAQRARQLAA